jgi:magnesium chelatase family protein
MNPCPCGYLGDDSQPCRCSARSIERYRGRISGPLLDRIDIRIEVPRPTLEELRGTGGDSSALEASGAGVQRQIVAARNRQLQRAGCINARLPTRRLAKDCQLDRGAALLLERGKDQLALSGRGLHRLLRLGRTIADLADCEAIAADHLAEAMQLRRPLA